VKGAKSAQTVEAVSVADKIDWPDLELPPINQHNMPCALWFYYPIEYEVLMGYRNI